MEPVSRREILSRSRDDLTFDAPPEDEDVWYDQDSLVKSHINEVLLKWDRIDDGIWAKAIVLEKNRRVAKAYVRSPILTVNGSDLGFDGHRIGLKGFDNPVRDQKSLEVITRHVGQGVKIRMDNKGSIEIKKLSSSSVYVKPLGEETAISDEVGKSGTLDNGKQMVFDIKKFEANVSREMRRATPNRAKLESQCILALAFAKCPSVLQCPSWVMIINVVAMDMLRSMLPIGPNYSKIPNIRNRPRLPVPEEDPYSVTGLGSGTSSGGSSGKERNGKDKPPKLPPRDNNQGSNKSSSRGEYDSEENSFWRFKRMTKNNTNAKDKDRKYDDPYYCGLRARIPNVAKPKGSKDKASELVRGPAYPPATQPNHPSTIFHSRNYDTGMGKRDRDAHVQSSQVPYFHNLERNQRNPCSWVPSQGPYESDFTESPYAHIYGRLPVHRAYRNPAQLLPHGMYARDWD